MFRLSWGKETSNILLPLFFVFLTSPFFLNFVHARKGTSSPSNSSSLLSNNKTSNSSEVVEELPTPEALSWGLHGPHSNYLSGQSYHDKKNHPVILAQHEIEKYLKDNPSKGDNYYRNRKGEWIYIVPEEEVLEKIDIYPITTSNPYGRRKPYRNNHFSRQFHKASNSYNTDSSITHPRYSRPVITPPPPTNYYQPEESASFLTRLLNTGNGFLRFLNPLTYLRPQDSSSHLSYYNPKDQREYYKSKSSYSYPTPYRRKPTQPYLRHGYENTPSKFGNAPTLDDDFHHNGEQLPSKISNSFSSNEYEYENEYLESGDTESGHENNYDYEDYVKNHNTHKTSYPRTPLGFDSKKINAHGKDSSSSHTDANNIYKFVDLEMLYDSHNIGSIENVKDKQTLDYLKENQLRDDLYIGKDGNLYIKNDKKDDTKMNRLGYQMYGRNRRVPVKRKATLPSSEEKVIKRSTYKVINRRPKNSRRLP